MFIVKDILCCLELHFVVSFKECCTFKLKIVHFCFSLMFDGVVE